MLMQLDGLMRQIGGRVLYQDASLVVRAGDRIGLVGPNGAGKSTLLRALFGDEPPDAGSVTTARGVRVGMLRQEIDPSQEHSVRREASSALAHLDALEQEMRELEASMAELGARGGSIPAELAERYDRAVRIFESSGGFDRDARVARVLAGLGFDEAACERPLRSFSGGWLMRVELAKLLLRSPDVLLLDEPTNHLDLPAIQWFEETLESFPGAVIIVSHDRTFLRKHVDRVAELDGHGGFALYEGSYDRYLSAREQRRGELLARKANQDRQIAQMERFVERFRAKATKARQAQSRLKAIEKIERIEIAPGDRRAMRLRIPPPPRAGEVVVRLTSIRKSYGDKTVYDGVDLAVGRGDRVALAGPNGAGKSTLLRIVAGVLEIDSGERRLGHNVQVAFYAQHQLEALDPALSVLDELGRGACHDDYPRLRSHLGAFLFSGEEVDKPVSVLSGGEKARLALAKMLLRPANLLVLDEPTNHLDIQSCEVLEQALAGYEGTLVFVSHDRTFINALATRVVEVRSGCLREFSGNYDDYLARSQATVPATASGASPPTPSETPGMDGPRPDKAARQREREQRKSRDRTARQIERIETEIERREAELEAATWRMGDPAVYSSPEPLQEAQADQARLQALIDELYRDWERLSVEVAALDDALEQAR
jgi:ATP-binding cassette subfamily F protein 3